MRLLPPPEMRRALRRAAGLSQLDVAELIGVSRAAVSRWESGARRPQRSNRIRYHSVLAELRRQVLL